MVWVMYGAYLFCMASFLLLPIICYAIHFLDRKFMPWWLLLLILTIGGWLLINAAYRSYDLYSEMILAFLPESTEVEATRKDMSYAMEADFALYFGWLLLPLLALLLSPFYAFINFLKTRNHGQDEY
ncbi:MAG: hypothetical protein ACYC4Q_09240 [Victivallaceae bacterium]